MKHCSFNKIPNSLRKHRLQMGLTQKAVAKKLGFKSPNRLVRWEHGYAFPSIKNLLKLSAIYATLCDQLYRELFTNIKNELLHVNKSDSITNNTTQQ